MVLPVPKILVHLLALCNLSFTCIIQLMILAFIIPLESVSIGHRRFKLNENVITSF